MQLIETDLEFATVDNKMTDSEMIQTVTDNGVTDTITNTKCNGVIDNSIVMKITDEVVKNNITTSHNDVDSNNIGKSEQNNVVNNSEVAQLNGIENNIQKEEKYCENNHVSEPIMEISEVKQKGDKDLDNKNGAHNETIIQKESSTENIEHLNITTTADIDTITEHTSADKEKHNDNPDSHDGITVQTEEREQTNIKTTADLDTITEPTSVDKEKHNDNPDSHDGITVQTDDLEQSNIKTAADLDTITEPTSVDKEKGNNNFHCNDDITMQTEDFDHINIEPTADEDALTEYAPADKEKGNDNVDCNDDITMQTEDIEYIKIKTTATMDAVTESTAVDKEKGIDCKNGITIQTEGIEQLKIIATANIDTITESTTEGKEIVNDNPDSNHGISVETEDMLPHEKGNNVVMSDMEAVTNSERDHTIDANKINVVNLVNDAMKSVDTVESTIEDIKNTDNPIFPINEDDISVVKNSNLEDNGNSNDSITADNELLSIKQTEDENEDKFDNDDMAALVYSNSESEDANDHVSSECESISNAEDKILYENEDSGDSMEVTETAISASVTEAIDRLTDSPITTVLKDDLMEVTDTAISAALPESDNDSPIVTVLEDDLMEVTDPATSAVVTNADVPSPITTLPVPQDDSMEVTETTISSSVTEAADLNSITTVIKKNAGDVNEVFINDVPELKNTTVDIRTNANCMEIDNESNIISISSVPELTSKLADCNDITESDNKDIDTVNTTESAPLQEDLDLNTDSEKMADKHKQSEQSDINVDCNAKEEDNNKPSALENDSDSDCILKTNESSNVVPIINNEIDANQSSDVKDACSDEKIELKSSEEKKVTDVCLLINKDVIPDTSTQHVENSILKKKDTAITSCLANTLDILSDDEDEQVTNDKNNDIVEKPCINLEDDDDIMLIDDDSSSKECEKNDTSAKQEINKQSEDTLNKDIGNKCKSDTASIGDCKELESGKSILMSILKSKDGLDEQESVKDDVKKSEEKEKGPLVIPNFVQSFKSDISNMTRIDLEEFCLLKIVEGLVDRSNLSEIKTKLKTMVQHVEEWRKKAMMLTKQNRDLQIVLKTVQEDQKKRTVGQITPLRITRSVGMQVFMNDNVPVKRTKVQHALQNKHQRPPTSPQQKVSKSISIPVPRLVPATNSSPLKTIKSPPPQVNSNVNIPIKHVTTPQAVARTIIPQTKVSEKRPHNNSVTVDLTDDEPPTKLANINKTPSQKFRLVPSQQLMQPNRMPTPTAPNTRKVYIPISGTQNQGLVPGQTIVFKSMPPGARPRGPTPQRMTTPTRVVSAMIPRHPAPLPEVGKQPRPIHWKPLPPSPELKISKVENGIVISWKIDGYQEDIYEKIASYQLFAYQETTAPPNTLHWKKIGDVKALALPMACTLTQFMAGYKYYFAVRAVDIRSRFGPFSLPGSILLMNKKTD